VPQDGGGRAVWTRDPCSTTTVSTAHVTHYGTLF
jgi:hypothetical protein